MTSPGNASLRVAIVDDEPLARELLASYVARRGDLDLIGEAESGDAAVSMIVEDKPDLVLLDIEMPGTDGFGVLDRLHQRNVQLPLVVFVTAFDRYAVRAFDVHAVDYLLKPVTCERFDEAVDRCRTRTEHPVQDVPALLEDALHRTPRRLLVRRRRRIVPVPVDSIDWIQADDDYVKIHAGKEEYLFERTLKQMEALLSSAGFVRVHRSAMVNLACIRDMKSLGSSRYEIVLRDGTRLPVSRSYSARFREEFL